VAGSAVVALGARAYVGLVAAGDGAGGRAQAAFDGVAAEEAPPGLPWPWAAHRVGAPAGGARAAYAAGRYTVEGGGTLGGPSDALHLLAQQHHGAGALTARLDAFDAFTPEAQAGLMVRSGLDERAPYVFLRVSAAGRVSLLARPARGAPVVETPGIDGSVPLWLRLVWGERHVSAFTSPDGRVWTEAGRLDVELGYGALAGLVVAGPASPQGRRGAGEATFASVGMSGAGSAPVALGDPAATGASAGVVPPFGIEAAYPNPSRDRVALRLAVDRPGRVAVEVLDVLGRRVLAHAFHEGAPVVREVGLDVSALPSGAYVVRARHEAGGQAATRITVLR
jgi:hypothetical protein